MTGLCKDSCPRLSHNRRLKVVFMGEYQEGKSLIINCLFNKYICKIGKGLETTKEIYCVGSYGGFDIYDSMGFCGDLMSPSDALEKAKGFDSVIFVCKGSDLKNYKLEFLKNLVNEEIPFSIIFNVNSDKCKDDESETENIVCSIIERCNDCGISPIPILDKEILCFRPHYMPNIDKLSRNKRFAPNDITPSLEESGILHLREFFGKPKNASLNLSDYLSIFIEIRKYLNGNMG